MTSIKKVQTLNDLWQERLKQSAQSTFVTEDGRKYSYQEIDFLANKQMELLQNNGIKKGDLIAIQFELDLANIVTVIACIKMGVVINPLNPHFDIDEINSMINRFKPYAIISQKSVRGRDTLSNIANLDNYQTKKIADLVFFTRKKHLPSEFIGGDGSDTPALVLNTSGTSGLYKGVVLTNKNIISAESAYNDAFGITKNDMTLILSGMYHAIGFHHGLISTIMAGSHLAIIKHYNIEQVAKMLEEEPITYIDSLPTIMYDLLFKVQNLGKLRMLICGGDKIKESILVQAKKRNIPLYNCYGLTEAVPFSYTPQDYYLSKGAMTTAVKPMTNIKVRLVKNKNIITDSNKQGQIEVTGPIIFKCYLADPEKTAKAFDGEWFVTGDVGHYNEDNLLEIDGRNSDKIIRGGENISAHMVEDKIKGCQNIEEVAVLGVPDVRLGQRIGAFIVLNHGQKVLTKAELISELEKQHVDKKLWPEKLWVVDSLPKTSNGKIKKYLLKNWLEGKKVNEE